MAVEVCGNVCVREREREKERWPSAGLLQGALPG